MIEITHPVISFESRPLIFVYLYLCTQSIQKEIVEYDIKSKYPEEYSTIDNVGQKKLLPKKSSFVKNNRLLISYLISKQAQLNPFKRALVIYHIV